MQLSKIDRILLANQYRILEKLDPFNAEIYASNCKVLEDGFALNYAALDQRFKDGLTAEQCSEAIRILLMFEALHHGYVRSKGAIEAEIDSIAFHGFDGESEAALLAYAAYLIHDEGRFPVLDREHLDSGTPMLALYRRMLWEWEKSADKYTLEAADIRRIERARSAEEEPSAEAVWRAFAPRGFPPPVSLSSSIETQPSAPAPAAEPPKSSEPRKTPPIRKRQE
jgi:uncharacterized protein YfbU (UPF0304 family)